MIGTMTEARPPVEQDHTTTMTARRATEQDCVTPMTTIDAGTSDSEPEAGRRIAKGESPSDTMIWNPIGIVICPKRIARGTGSLREKQ